MKSVLFFLPLLFFYTAGYSQLEITGTVVDDSTGKPIPYANVGIADKGVGTVSDEEGNFKLVIPQRMEHLHLSFSHLSYETKKVEISDKKVVRLKPSTVQLSSVVVEGSAPVIIGHTPRGNEVKGFFTTKALGTEGGTLIRNIDPAHLKTFNFHVQKVTFKKLLFRLNFYEAKRNRPGRKLNEREIIFEIPGGYEGVLGVPLEAHNIKVNGSFICTIELIKLEGSGSGEDEFYFSAFQEKDRYTYRRYTSFAKWERFKDVGICFWLEVKK
jgi:hypothetical protein